ncbi:kinase-like domain-containing protein [Geopyxis carbonaria]|nr:kinase-like domain-containing protein [Geopyxis carbonaria]
MECMRDSFKEGVMLGGRYEAMKLLNKGSYGMVYLARDTITDDNVAVKCMLKPGSAAVATSGLSIDELSQEIEVHETLGKHPHIVNMTDSFETECHSFIVLEFCPMGDLYEALRDGRGPLETEHVREFMLQLVAAVEYMHSKGIYHRDIKPENIFLTRDGDVKLGDFGLATTEAWTEENCVGSDRYMAPEQYDALGGYAPHLADLWAIGIILLNILFQRNPFNTPTENDPIFADYVLDRESLFDIFPTLSYDTYEVLTNCLALNPEKRSLAGLRDAIERVVSWTIDDESFDDFCTEDREIIPAETTREPLRTPSLQTPAIDNGSAFPWAQALSMSPMQRQLSIIEDEIEEPVVQYSEDMFKNNPDDYAKDMGYFIPQPSSYDSAMGASFPSVPIKKDFTLRTDKIEIKNKIPVPAKADKFVDVTLGSSVESCSKSWSDIFMDDDEEEECDRLAKEKERKRNSWSFESDNGYADDDAYDVEWVGGGWDDLTV